MLDLCIIWESEEIVLVFIDERLVYRGRMPAEADNVINWLKDSFENLHPATFGEVPKPTTRSYSS